MAQQQVIEAVVRARDEDTNALLLRVVGERVRHAVLVGKGGNAALEDGDVRRRHAEVGVVEGDALVVARGGGVGVLVRGEDVAAEAEEELGDDGDDSLAVRAGDEERREGRGGRGWRGGGGGGGGRDGGRERFRRRAACRARSGGNGHLGAGLGAGGAGVGFWAQGSGQVGREKG